MATSREIKDNAIKGLIGIISECVKKHNGKINLNRINIGSGRIHNEDPRNIFEREAIRLLQHWKFQPQLAAGEPI